MFKLNGASGMQIAVFLMFLFVLCTMARPTTAQKIEIALRDSPLLFTPDGFYIADVIDMRDYPDAAGWFAAVKRFIEHHVQKNTSLHPVEIGLKTFRLTETKLPDNRVEGHVNLNLSFDLQTAYSGPHHLTGYNGSAVYTRNAGNPQDIGPILTHALENGLAYFNHWMDKEAGTNIYLAKGVKLSFTDYKENTEGDTIYYAADRPLTWADFRSDVANSEYDADVFPSIGYDEQLEVNKGIINIRIDLKAFLPKSACWVKNGSRNDYTLNHEQRHFDIAKIAAEHFKQKLKTENLPVGNYDGYINVDYLDAYREMNALQKQYDDETRHGSNQYEQQEWNERIDSLLRSP